MEAPFPYFGGKSKISHYVWKRFGRVDNYIEPFFGSGAMLLNRPLKIIGIETVNDLNGYIANFWRSIQHDPESVIKYTDSPLFENDLHAWHYWLVQRKEDLVQKLEGDPEYFDAKIAGKWCWGMCCWIGSGFCEGGGPWKVLGGKFIKTTPDQNDICDTGVGVNRKRIHLGNTGVGVNRKRIHLGNTNQNLSSWINSLAVRLRYVRVCCGDWSRICGPSPTTKLGLTAVFLDPPYSVSDRSNVYGHTEDFNVAQKVREWCVKNQDNPLLRIALCGYEGEHNLPGWDCWEWKARGGYAGQNQDRSNSNSNRERVWFNQSCLKGSLKVKENHEFWPSRSF